MKRTPQKMSEQWNTFASSNIFFAQLSFNGGWSDNVIVFASKRDESIIIVNLTSRIPPGSFSLLSLSLHLRTSWLTTSDGGRGRGFCNGLCHFKETPNKDDVFSAPKGLIRRFGHRQWARMHVEDGSYSHGNTTVPLIIDGGRVEGLDERAERLGRRGYGHLRSSIDYWILDHGIVISRRLNERSLIDYRSSGNGTIISSQGYRNLRLSIDFLITVDYGAHRGDILLDRIDHIDDRLAGKSEHRSEYWLDYGIDTVRR